MKNNILIQSKINFIIGQLKGMEKVVDILGGNVNVKGLAFLLNEMHVKLIDINNELSKGVKDEKDRN